MVHGFCSIFSQHTLNQQQSFAHTASPDKIQDAYPNLDNHHQSFGRWSTARVNASWLSWAQQSISMHDAIQLVNVWNSNLVFVQPGAKINTVYYCDSVLEQGLLPDICRLLKTTSRFSVMERRHRHTVHATVAYLHSHVLEFIELDNWPPHSLDLIPVDYSVWDVATDDDVVAKFQTLTSWIACWTIVGLS